MTSRCVRNGDGHPLPGQLKEIIISCDHMSCTTSVNDETIKAGGGLRNMGWEATFQERAMKHYCPEHRPTKE